MEDWEIDIINWNLYKLVNTTVCTPMLLTMLRQKKLLTLSEKQELEKPVDTDITKAERLYDTLIKKTDGFQGLIDVLNSKDVGQTIASAILEKAREEVKTSNDSELPSPVPQTNEVLRHAPLPPQQCLPPPDQSELINMGANVPAEADLDVTQFESIQEPFLVFVKKPNAKMQYNDDFYKLPPDEKGYALFINITEFDKSEKREPAEQDKIYMCDLWTELGYRIRPYDGYITKSRLVKILSAFKNEVTKRKARSIVVFIGSHGEYNEIKTSDEKTVQVLSEIVYEFNTEGCEALNGKPKIFLISACQTISTNTGTNTDKVSRMPVAIEDAIVTYSSSPEYLSKKDKHLGTWFTHCLTKVIMENAHQFDLKTMVERTQETMMQIKGNSADGDGQVCTLLESSIFRKLYFNLNP